VLGDEPVPAMDYLKYYNFTREVYKAKNRYSGGYALTTEVQILVDKWVARQAVKRMLEKTRDECSWSVCYQVAGDRDSAVQA
jgi:hypothetical protein